MNRFVSLVALCIALCSASNGDTITLTNGDRISGEVTGLSANVLTIKTSYAGVLFINQDQIAQLHTENEFVVIKQDGTTLSMVLDDEISVADIVLMRTQNKDAFNIGTSWRKNVVFSLVGARGNSQSQIYAVNGQSNLVRPKSEQILTVGYIRELVQSTTQKNRLDVKYGHRWLRQGKWFTSTNVDYFRDPLKDISWRAVVGTGIGKKFRDFSDETFSVEAAASGVYETLENIEGISPAIRLGANYRRLLFGGRIEAFQNTRFLWISQTAKGVIDSTNGMRLALSNQFNFDVRGNVQYETEPAKNIDSVDFTYSIGLGVVF